MAISPRSAGTVAMVAAASCLATLGTFSSASAQAVPLQPGPSSPEAAGADPSGAAAAGHALHAATTYYGDLFGNLSGGLQVGSAYQGRLGLILDADLGELAGWTGATAHMSVHQIHGQGITQGHVGALMTVSGLEAEPASRLFNLWIEQQIGDKATLRVGQFTAGQEFAISSGAGLFINSTFGWPAILAQDLPSGGPAYPLATPGLRLKYDPTPGGTVLVAIFNGDPAGPGGGDPQQRDSSGFNAFRTSGPPFLIGEVQQTFGRSRRDDPDLTIRVGAWAYLGDVVDRRAPPKSFGSGQPAMLTGDAGLYGIVDKVMWRRDARELGAFLRAAVSPSDRNLIDLYADGGLTLKAPIPRRPNDQIGLAIAYSRVPTAPRDEVALELTYQAQISSHWWIQPDLQYIVHPSAAAAAANDPQINATTPNALVAGVRNIFKF
jgi:porin